MGYRGAIMELKRKGVDRQLAQHVCDEAESKACSPKLHGS